MSILDWTISNTGIALCIGGGALAVGSGGIIYSSVKHSDELSYLFRHVPEHKGAKQKWSEVMDGKEFEEAVLVEHPYEKIIDGDKEYNGGNYIIYYGSEACGHCTKFIFNNAEFSDGSLDVSKHKMSHGTWMQAFEFTREDKELKKLNIRFIMFEDVPDKKNAAEDESKWTLPWSAYRFDNKNKGIVKGEMIRKDSSAKNFKKIMDKAQKKFGAKKIPGTPTVIAYKSGNPVVFNKDSLEKLKLEQQDESMSNENILITFIKHYYTKHIL